MTVIISTKNSYNKEKQSKDSYIFRYAIVIEYNGENFSGSQKQLNQRTVQSELEKNITILTKLNITTIFSGRTDSGVSAEGQVAHFDLPFQIDEYKFLYSINALLPDDISISAVREVDKNFHSQKNALMRWYRYKIHNRRQRSVWMKNALHIHSELDLSEMSKAVSYLEGIHDFSCFKKASSSNPYNDCNMYYAKCTRNADIVYVDLVANRFLYNMVRIIVGSLVDIGLGIYTADYMQEILNSKSRAKAGKTVKPEGLTFIYVGYNKEYNNTIYNGLNKEAIYNEKNILCKAS